MKKTDTYYLSDKQIEQIKKSDRKSVVVGCSFLVSLISIILICVLSNLLTNAGVKSETIEIINGVLFGIISIGIITGIIFFFIQPHSTPEIDEETRKELEEMGKTEDYPRRRNGV